MITNLFRFQELKKPVPEKRTIISQVEKALKGYTQSFDVELRDKKDPLLQSQNSRKAVEYLFNNLLVQTKGFKFVETLQVKFVKDSDDKPIQKNGYFNSTTDLIINKTDIKLAIQASQQQILNKIAQWISEGSGWTIQSIENHYINIVNYSPLKGPGGYSPKIPIRVCAAQRGRDFGTPYLKRGIHFRDVS